MLGRTKVYFRLFDITVSSPYKYITSQCYLINLCKSQWSLTQGNARVVAAGRDISTLPYGVHLSLASICTALMCFVVHGLYALRNSWKSAHNYTHGVLHSCTFLYLAIHLYAFGTLPFCLHTFVAMSCDDKFICMPLALYLFAFILSLL